MLGTVRLQSLLCLLLSLLGSVLLVSGAFADLTSGSVKETPATLAGMPMDSEDQKEWERLMQSTEQWTEIATRSRMNADDVPGIVSVLYGDELEAKGIQSVAQALMTVPGMNFSATSQGFGKTVVRGVPKHVAAGHIKILLDGVPLVTAYGIDPVPNLPIAQIERIDIIRGPASSLYGEFAFSGVVDIITRKEGQRLFCEMGKGSTYLGGGIASFRQVEKDIRLIANFSGLKTQNDTANQGYGPVIMAAPSTSGEEAETFDKREALKRRQGIGLVSLDYGDVAFKAHGFDYGLKQGGNQVFTADRFGGEGRIERNILPQTRLKFWFGGALQEYDPDEWYSNTRLSPLEDWIYGLHYEEENVYAKVGVTDKSLNRHVLLFEALFAQTKLEEVYRHETSYTPSSTPSTNDSPLGSDDAFETVNRSYYQGKGRYLTAVTLQDDFDLTDRIHITATGRYDHYNDIGDKFSPRIASIFRLQKKRSSRFRHILKLQYAKAFRPLSFLERYEPSFGNAASNLQNGFETIETVEGGYIFRYTHLSVARLTLFYSDLNAILEPLPIRDRQMDRFFVKGIEAEFEQHFWGDRLTLDLNLSRLRAFNRDLNHTIPGTAQILSNLTCVVNPTAFTSIAFTYRYEGDIAAGSFDGNVSPNDTHVSDITLTHKFLCAKGLTLRGGGKNIFKETQAEAGIDFGEEGRDGWSSSPSERVFWIQLTYDF